MDAYVATLARPAWDKKSDTNVRGDKLEVIVQVPVVTQSTRQYTVAISGY